MVTPQRQEKIEGVVSRRQAGFVLVIENIADPHNAAAMIRSCDAFGIQEVYFIFEKTESYDPKEIGKYSSSYANKWLTYHQFDSTKECLDHLKQQGYTVVGTILDNQAQSFYETDFTDEKLAIMVGNEGEGLSDLAAQMCDKKVYLPMQGFTESFNVSVAAALFICEAVRQRAVSGNDYVLSLQDQERLVRDFMQR